MLGVLVEKAKTTPEYYPMTLAGIATGCNQKSNRDPVTNYDIDDVEEILQGLRKKGAVIMVDAGGRALRWKHTLYEWMKVTRGELAVLAELMLRGPQTEGDLRARTSRMEPIADLPALQAVLDALVPRDLVIYLSPRGQKRGVVVTHGLYPADEAQKVRKAFANSQAALGVDDDEAADPAVRAATTRQGAAAGLNEPAWAVENKALRAEIDDLKSRLEDLTARHDALAAEVRGLKTELGV